MGHEPHLNLNMDMGGWSLVENSDSILRDFVKTFLPHPPYIIRLALVVGLLLEEVLCITFTSSEVTIYWANDPKPYGNECSIINSAMDSASGYYTQRALMRYTECHEWNHREYKHINMIAMILSVLSHTWNKVHNNENIAAMKYIIPGCGHQAIIRFCIYYMLHWFPIRHLGNWIIWIVRNSRDYVYGIWQYKVLRLKCFFRGMVIGKTWVLYRYKKLT